MFKSVEYAGFEGYPEARGLAERATFLLASEISLSWHEQVEVLWETYPDNPKVIELTTAIQLPIGLGTGSCLIPVGEFADEDLLRYRLRSVWDRTLGSLLDKRRRVWDELLHQPAEV